MQITAIIYKNNKTQAHWFLVSKNLGENSFGLIAKYYCILEWQLLCYLKTNICSYLFFFLFLTRKCSYHVFLISKSQATKCAKNLHLASTISKTGDSQLAMGLSTSCYLVELLVPCFISTKRLYTICHSLELDSLYLTEAVKSGSGTASAFWISTF